MPTLSDQRLVFSKEHGGHFDKQALLPFARQYLPLASTGGHRGNLLVHLEDWVGSESTVTAPHDRCRTE